MSRTSSFFILGGQLASSGGQTLFSDSLKLQLYQHRGQLNLLKVEVYLKPPHLNVALWGGCKRMQTKGREGVYDLQTFATTKSKLSLKTCDFGSGIVWGEFKNLGNLQT